MQKKAVVEFTSKGIYCSKGKFYIDPWKPVPKAVITHAHADHAYFGHLHYLAQKETLPLLYYRVGRPNAHFYGLEYGEEMMINGVKLSLHPAGHILGSSQVRLEVDGEVWVISGDYKLTHDGVSEPFESIKCDVFITESTFALPCFHWKDQKLIFDEINAWWRSNQAQGITSILMGYSLGKAQHLLKGVDATIGPLYAHGAVWNMTEIFRQNHPNLFPPLLQATSETSKKQLAKALILAPPSAARTPWMNRFQPYRMGYASGWMTLRGVRKRLAVDRGFPLSDHADWLGLQSAIKATGAKRIIVTHGFADIFSRWLQEKGFDAQSARAYP